MNIDTPVHIWIPYKGLGKARPRANYEKKRMYTERKYRLWKNKTIAYLIKLKLEGLLPDLPNPCFIESFFCNFASSDADNLQGAIADSIVQADLLSDDCGSVVVGSSGKFVKVHKKRNEEKKVGIAIKIYPASIEWMDIDSFL